MAYISLYIQDEEIDRWVEVMHANGFRIEDDPAPVPEWQQEEVLRTLRETHPDDYVPWEEVRLKLFRSRDKEA